ncbi:uncharacterized protein A4U43_C07F9460 [Asparagus officinalis]|uniref:Uncharacterized protein n=1 Tax=Asparagus officinalis TaxID=4686 RepID=A0A5P1ECI0_ASPOF|nr:uncharacterized protein A4U43_C07F9460 [Asparagus officinalis]
MPRSPSVHAGLVRRGGGVFRRAMHQAIVGNLRYLSITVQSVDLYGNGPAQSESVGVVNRCQEARCAHMGLDPKRVSCMLGENAGRSLQ